MEVLIKNNKLKELYVKGKSKKYKIPQEILKKFFMGIQQLEAADSIYDLWKTTSLNFEKLKGFENMYSIRLTKQWRLEMKIEWQNEEKTKGIIDIMELSKHYGD